MPRVSYERYNPKQFNGDLEFLSDADEYYQDILHRVGELTSPKIFITSWLLHPWIYLNRRTNFRKFIVDQLRKTDSEVRILWNTNYNGRPYPNLLDEASSFYKNVVKEAAVEKGRLQIILSTQLEFHLPDFPLGTDFLLMLPGAPDPEEELQEAWMKLNVWKKAIKKRAPSEFFNLATATLGTHHQKTLLVIGKKGGNKELVAYCGGLDFSSGPSGYRSKSETYHGGKWWHDTSLRVRGKPAIPILENFIERWNDDLEKVDDGEFKGFGLSSGAELDDVVADGIQEGSLDVDKFEVPRTMPGDDDTLDAYEDWIPKAKDHIFIVNQYVRHPEIAELLLEQLDDEAGLRLTIIMPSYTEEMGERKDLIRIRENYAKRGASTEVKNRLLARAQKLSLTIDPINKLTLYLRSKTLSPLVSNSRCRIWIPIPLTPSQKQVLSIPYIHAKMMMIDRKAFMVGSANVNGRSLDGKADTEINILITDTAQINRIFSIHKWDKEPEDQWASDYPTSWYKKHRLVRYSQDHLRIDQEYGRFPNGRAGILEYFDEFKKFGKFEDLKEEGLSITKARLEQLLDSDFNPINLDRDIGEQFASMLAHLI